MYSPHVQHAAWKPLKNQANAFLGDVTRAAPLPLDLEEDENSQPSTPKKKVDTQSNFDREESPLTPQEESSPGSQWGTTAESKVVDPTPAVKFAAGPCTRSRQPPPQPVQGGDVDAYGSDDVGEVDQLKKEHAVPEADGTHKRKIKCDLADVSTPKSKRQKQGATEDAKKLSATKPAPKAGGSMSKKPGSKVRGSKP